MRGRAGVLVGLGRRASGVPACWYAWGVGRVGMLGASGVLINAVCGALALVDARPGCTSRACRVILGCNSRACHVILGGASRACRVILGCTW